LQPVRSCIALPMSPVLYSLCSKFSPTLLSALSLDEWLDEAAQEMDANDEVCDEAG